MRKRLTRPRIGAPMGALIIASLIPLAPCRAGGGATGTPTLSDVLITASRLDGGLTGASVSVISAQQIDDYPDQNLSDVLAQQAGVQVQDVFGAVNGTDATIDLRGFGAAATPKLFPPLGKRTPHGGWQTCGGPLKRRYQPARLGWYAATPCPAMTRQLRRYSPTPGP